MRVHIMHSVSHHHMHRHVYACACMMGIAPTHLCATTRMGYPPIHIGTYTYVCPLCTHSMGCPPTTRVPTRTYHCVYTYVYMWVPVIPTHAMGLVCAWVLRGAPMRYLRGGSLLHVRRVAPPPPFALRYYGCVSARLCGAVGRPRGAPMPLRGVLSHSESLRGLQWAPVAPGGSEALRMA